MLEIVKKFVSAQDVFMLSALFIFGAIGALAKFIIVNYDFEKKAHEIEKPKFKSYDAGIVQMLSRILIGAIAALLLGLSMIDAIKPESGPFFKLLLLGFIAGYIAPELFRSQEKRMLKYLATHLHYLPGIEVSDENTEESRDRKA